MGPEHSYHQQETDERQEEYAAVKAVAIFIPNTRLNSSRFNMAKQLADGYTGDIHRQGSLSMSGISAGDEVKTQIRRWGNSMGVRLPRAVLTKAHLAEGTTVKIEQTSKGILLTPTKQPKAKRKYTLRQ